MSFSRRGLVLMAIVLSLLGLHVLENFFAEGTNLFVVAVSLLTNLFATGRTRVILNIKQLHLTYHRRKYKMIFTTEAQRTRSNSSLCPLCFFLRLFFVVIFF